MTTTHTDPTAANLLRGVLLRPADDTARLVYADRLEEIAGTVPCPSCKGDAYTLASEGATAKQIVRGNSTGSSLVRTAVRVPKSCCHGTGTVSDGFAERAEFIRDQVWLWANPSCGSCTGPERSAGKSCSECREREERRGRTAVEMFGRERWLEWSRPANLCVPQGALWDDHIQFARGFVSEIHLPLAAFMQHAEALFAAHPIERVTLTDRQPMQWGNTAIWDWDTRYFTVEQCAGDADRIPYQLTTSAERGLGSVMFTEIEDAREWLSARCVAYGRSLAGLPVS